MEPKHTKEYAEKLASKLYPDKTTAGWLDHWSRSSQTDFVSGYMRAIQDTAAPELLEALQNAKRRIEMMFERMPLGELPTHARGDGWVVHQEYTTNYGRVRGVRGSGGWGVGPNYVWFWTELTEERIKIKSDTEKIKLGSGRIVTIKEAKKILKNKINN